MIIPVSNTGERLSPRKAHPTTLKQSELELSLVKLFLYFFIFSRKCKHVG